MIFKQFLEDLSRTAASVHPYASTNVNGIEINHTGIYFDFDTTDLDNIKNDLAQAEKHIEKQDKEISEKDKELEGKDIELNKLNEWAAQIKQDGNGAVFSELLENNQWQEQELMRYKETVRNFLAKLRENDSIIEKLRARKNTAKVMERDRNSGKLIAEYQGKQYMLELIQENK